VVVVLAVLADRLAVLPDHLRRDHGAAGQEIEERVVHRSEEPENCFHTDGLIYLSKS